MLRPLAQPLHARGLVGWIGLTRANVDSAGDSLVDEGLLVSSSSLTSFCLPRMERRIRRSL